MRTQTILTAMALLLYPSTITLLTVFVLIFQISFRYYRLPVFPWIRQWTAYWGPLMVSSAGLLIATQLVLWSLRVGLDWMAISLEGTLCLWKLLVVMLGGSGMIVVAWVPVNAPDLTY